ncbi:hypothetical protein GCM10022251_19950 [Phytohabitans flavus]|uniref:Uncharacterized protein n=1 Tax=Phytohabitans flavus TaxID=1076124 RepID=A0A6F8XZL2_9ACTN|nr:hypothetical protein [Phytohabitans flavus]BCB79171.1 hypothetical protein Pflav_055810 [Phytohabitans flavus]
MHVLFLGGPWHGERHEVVPSRRARGSEGLPQQYSVRESLDDRRAGGGLPGLEDAAPAGEHVVYTRRFAQAGGERRAVYVAPDYRGPARA